MDIELIGVQPPSGDGYSNAKCAATLSNTENWTKYVNTNLATKAMGGPTIEMFAKSYNAKYPSKTIEYKLETTDSNKGYKVKWNSDSDYSYYISGLENDGFYYLSSSDNVDGCWLASPSLRDSYSVAAIGNGSVTWETCSIGAYEGVRPVVCLNSDIQVTSTTSDEGETTWTIQK